MTQDNMTTSLSPDEKTKPFERSKQLLGLELG